MLFDLACRGGCLGGVGGELWVEGGVGEGSELVGALSVDRGSVKVALAEHNDADVRVEIDAPGFGAHEPGNGFIE